MKSSTRTIRRLGGGHPTGSVELGDDRLVIRLPDPIVLRLIARSVLLFAAVLCFPWIRAGLIAAATAPAAANAAGSRWIEEPFYLPMLLRDLRRQGLLKPGDRAVFLGDSTCRLSVLRQNHVDPIPEHWKPTVADRTVDFVLAADGFVGPSFNFVNRVLRTGGVLAVRLGSDPSRPFRLPPNYRMVYIRRFGSTVVAVKKIAHAAYGDDSVGRRAGRRLLAVLGGKSPARDWLLEAPPDAGRRRGRYIPDLIWGSLDGHPILVFMEVGPPERSGRRYPKGGRNVEIITMDLVEAAVAGVDGNVREGEEYLVMKAKAEAEADVEVDMVAAGASSI